MRSNKSHLVSSLAVILASVVLAVATVQADSRDTAPGYATDSEGNIILSGSDECIRSGSWSPDLATVVGCDGVVLEREIEIIEGAPTGLVTVITFPAAALFDFAKDDLKEEGRQFIETKRDELRAELAQAYAGIIIGHTDNVGSLEYNLGLSMRRAEAVRDYLVSTGTDPELLRVLGRAFNDPIASNDTDEGRAMNRRVEVVVVAEPRALDTIRFPSVALFPRRDWLLTPEAKELIERNRGEADVLLRRATYVEITGHTDDVGDDDYNQDLSEKRATSVRDYLVSTGLDPSVVVTMGAGEKQPVASNQTDEGRAENRRVDVLVLGRLDRIRGGN